jgi:hypothetical protein
MKVMSQIGLSLRGSKMNSNHEPRMYLILREDLVYKYIQGGHALAQYALEHPKKFEEWNNKYLICLSVFNGLSLRDMRDKLNKFGVTFSQFIEPDLESPLPTAICLFDNGKNGYRNFLKGLSLATK